MKKTLSLFLAVLMIATAFIVPASAGLVPDIREPGVCTCEDHNRTGPCHCCIYCENLDNTYVLDCCKKENLGGEEETPDVGDMDENGEEDSGASNEENSAENEENVENTENVENNETK